MTSAEQNLARPVAVEPVPGSAFAVAIVGVAPTTSGPAVASAVTGAGAVAVAVVVAGLGLAGSSRGWGPTVSGAFAVLAGCGGVASLVLGTVAIRQIRRSGGAVAGRPLAVTGLLVGGAGLALTVLAFVAVLLASR